MKFLTIDYIKQHSRIDFDCEDAELELYGAAAENTVLTTVRRTIDNVRDLHDGKIPPEYYQAALMLTDTGYQHRSPVSPQNMSIVPYTLDLLIKKEMRLGGGSDLEAERDTLLEMLNAVATDFAFDYDLTDDPAEALTEAYEAQMEKMQALYDRYKAISKPTTKVCARLRQDVAQAKTDCEAIINADYPTDNPTDDNNQEG